MSVIMKNLSIKVIQIKKIHIYETIIDLTVVFLPFIIVSSRSTRNWVLPGRSPTHS